LFPFKKRQNVDVFQYLLAIFVLEELYVIGRIIWMEIFHKVDPFGRSSTCVY